MKTASLSSARAPWPLSTSLKSDLPGHVPVHARGLYSLPALSPCTFHAEASVVFGRLSPLRGPWRFLPCLWSPPSAIFLQTRHTLVLLCLLHF